MVAGCATAPRPAHRGPRSSIATRLPAGRGGVPLLLATRLVRAIERIATNFEGKVTRSRAIALIRNGSRRSRARPPGKRGAFRSRSSRTRGTRLRGPGVARRAGPGRANPGEGRLHSGPMVHRHARGDRQPVTRVPPTIRCAGRTSTHAIRASCRTEPCSPRSSGRRVGGGAVPAVRTAVTRDSRRDCLTSP